MRPTSLAVAVAVVITLAFAHVAHASTHAVSTPLAKQSVTRTLRSMVRGMNAAEPQRQTTFRLTACRWQSRVLYVCRYTLTTTVLANSAMDTRTQTFRERRAINMLFAGLKSTID
jgi:hypothetical protein